MPKAESIIEEKINNNNYLLVNLVFAFFPLSFIFGSLFVNLNLLLFCCLGIFYLKSKILTTKFDFYIKIIFLFFLVIIFSTGLSFTKILYFEGYNNSDFIRLTKSILFFRFFLFLIIIYLLNKISILNFKYFFLASFVASIALSLDIIYQYISGYNILGFKSSGFHNSGFFGDEFIAGGFLLRFSFFTILFTIFVFKNKNYIKFISTAIVICILSAGILYSGNRMPFILFIFGIFLILLSNLKIKKILLVSLLTLFVSFKFIIMSNESYKLYIEQQYHSFYGSAKYMITLPSHFTLQIWNKQRSVEIEKSLRTKTYFYKVKHESYHKRLFLTAIDTWGKNKIFGNGIKSFRKDCWQLKGPDVNLTEDQYPGKKNRLCSNHPHNYYFEILTETGIVGLIIAFTIALLFVVFIIKKFRFIKQINIGNVILLSAIISLILETMPIRSTGSLFTTNNATYLILISSIVLSHKTLMKINNSK